MVLVSAVASCMEVHMCVCVSVCESVCVCVFVSDFVYFLLLIWGQGFFFFLGGGGGGGGVCYFKIIMLTFKGPLSRFFTISSLHCKLTLSLKHHLIIIKCFHLLHVSGLVRHTE